MLAAPHTSLPTQRELAGALRRGRRGPSACRSCSTTTRPAPASRSASSASTRSPTCPRSSRSRSRAATSRASSRCAGATRTASRSCAAPTTRPSTTSRGASAAGSPARPTCCPDSTSSIMDAANAGDHALAHRLFDGILPWVQDMESGSLQPEGEARPRPPRASPAATCASRCCRSTDDGGRERCALLDQALAVPLPESCRG